LTKRTIIAGAVVLFLISLLTGWFPAAGFQGRLQARVDVALGRYQLLGYGLPVAWRGEYARLLDERYGIQFHVVAGCLVSQSLVDYVAGYDSVSGEAAKRRFGHDIFKRPPKRLRSTGSRNERKQDLSKIDIGEHDPEGDRPMRRSVRACTLVVPPRY
jgi:hypothetical protein